MPANAGYYHAAYIAAAVIYLGYGLALWRRAQRLRGRQRAVSASHDQSEAAERRR
jgi:hypothetical protein